MWIDVLTSKQGMLLGTLAKDLISWGSEVLVTCREYEYTCRVLDFLGVPYLPIGRYSEGGPHLKVIKDGLRIAALAEVVRKFSPDYLIAYPNPSAARVAFGVGVRYLAITDSPHSVIPSRLSLSLADIVIFSDCIPTEEILPYISSRFTKILTYHGVDEVGWLKRLEPREGDIRELGLSPWEYVVFRPAEELATYYRGLELLPARRVLDVLLKLGYDVVLLPRYSKHKDLAREGVLIIDKGFSGPSLTYYARLVVTGGASMAREAVLLGTPAITYTPLELYVNSCVENWGFPLKRAWTVQKLEEIAREFVENPPQDRHSYISRCRSLEDPLTVLENMIVGSSR